MPQTYCLNEDLVHTWLSSVKKASTKLALVRGMSVCQDTTLAVRIFSTFKI